MRARVRVRCARARVRRRGRGEGGGDTDGHSDTRPREFRTAPRRAAAEPSRPAETLASAGAVVVVAAAAAAADTGVIDIGRAAAACHRRR